MKVVSVNRKLDILAQEIYLDQEMKGHPDQKASKDEVPAGLERHLASALEAAGWSLQQADAPISFWAKKGRARIPIVFRYARDARRPILQALLADATLRGRSLSSGDFLAVIGAPSISQPMARSMERYMVEVAPHQPFGYVDERGLVRFHGLGLDVLRGEVSSVVRAIRQQKTPRDLFSDLNQWMLKVLAGRALSPTMLSIPRDPIRAAADLAKQGRVSPAAAWRLYSALRDGGYMDEDGTISLARDLFARWRAAAQRPQQRIGAKWILPGKAPADRLYASLARLHARSNEPVASLGLFAACDALGVGHVRGVPLHVYVRHLEPDLLEGLGLALVPEGHRPDLFLQVARWPESVFRAVVSVDGVPVTDVIQCWLDVSAEPARGAEQASVIWRRILGPAVANGEPEP